MLKTIILGKQNYIVLLIIIQTYIIKNFYVSDTVWGTEGIKTDRDLNFGFEELADW